MTLLDKKYIQIQPSEEYLTNKVLLAQAWKKAHVHIRSTNWYADNFELDRSAINLDETLDTWIAELEADNFTFNNLSLVPAPKSSKWMFRKADDNAKALLETTLDDIPDYSHSWEPEEDNIALQKELRPLAHISIRDQTIMTALMCCLANEVEALQGDTETAFDMVHEPKSCVVNYGNRLFCNHKQGKAHFNWGNSTTYSKYFSDYQRFLERPIHFGNEAQNLIGSGERVYEVQLDIHRFFDTISRGQLLTQLAKLIPARDELIQKLLSAFSGWQWESEAEKSYGKLCEKPKFKDGLPLPPDSPPRGIPQGLVAGGFLANIYLLDFDKKLAKLCEEPLEHNTDIQVVDCCRYVDDLRLFVTGSEIPSNLTPSEYTQNITQ